MCVRGVEYDFLKQGPLGECISLLLKGALSKLLDSACAVVMQSSSGLLTVGEVPMLGEDVRGLRGVQQVVACG